MAKMSNSKNHETTRILGQRLIPSTFLFRSASRPVEVKENVKANAKTPDKQLPVSLSDFLDRKLQKGPKLVQGKQKPFSSPAIGRVVSESSEVKIDRDKTEEADFSCGLDMAFEQLKHTGKESIDPVCFPAADGQVQTCSSTQDTQVSRKRGNSFEVGIETQPARKVLVTLGENQKNQQKARISSISKEKPMPKYNHYANGGGWWDSNMEGVDSEEVGCHEVWEGVGSTTLGGLEWH